MIGIPVLPSARGEGSIVPDPPRRRRLGGTRDCRTTTPARPRPRSGQHHPGHRRAERRGRRLAIRRRLPAGPPRGSRSPPRCRRRPRRPQSHRAEPGTTTPVTPAPTGGPGAEPTPTSRPAVEPSPTVEPSPIVEPSPAVEPSPTAEPPVVAPAEPAEPAATRTPVRVPPVVAAPNAPAPTRKPPKATPEPPKATPTAKATPSRQGDAGAAQGDAGAAQGADRLSRQEGGQGCSQGIEGTRLPQDRQATRPTSPIAADKAKTGRQGEAPARQGQASGRQEARQGASQAPGGPITTGTTIAMTGRPRSRGADTGRAADCVSLARRARLPSRAGR